MDLRENMALTPVESGHPVSAISLNLTTRCSLACSYCFSGCFKEYEGNDLTKEMAFKTVDWLMDPSTRGNNDRVDIGFWGGEPLMKWDLIKDIVLYAEEKAKEQGIIVTFGGTTNVVAFTEDKFDFMDEHHIHFLLSCDGVQRHHDEFRKLKNGKGSWEIVDKNMGLILKRWPNQEVRMSFTAENVSEIIEDLNYFVEKGFKNIVYSPVSEGDWTEERLKEMEIAWAEVAEWYLKDEKFKEINIKFIDDACDHYINHPVGDAAPCGAGRGYLGINYDGAIYPCLMPEALIRTPGGFKRIKNLEVGEEVLTHNNRYKKISRVWKKPYYGVSTVLSSHNVRINNFCTGDHPIYVLRDKKHEWVCASAIEETDFAVYPINREEQDISSITINGGVYLLDNDLCYLLGRSLSKDCFNYDPIKIYCKQNECELRLEKILKDKNISFTHKDFPENKKVVTIENALLQDWRNTCLKEGDISNISLPSWFMNLSDQQIFSFLKGLFEAGSLITRSFNYANQIQNLILFIGKIPRIDFEENLPFSRRYEISMLDTSENGFIKDGYFYDQFARKKLDRYVGRVLNLEVEDDHSYAGENIVYKNCHRFCKFEDARPWYEKEVCLGHIEYGILNHDWRKKFVNWSPDRDCLEKCKNCPAFKLSCTGGCWATNYDLSGDIAISPEINCKTAIETLKQADYMIRNVGAEYYKTQNETILPEVQGCECYNIQDALFGRYRMNKNEPYACLCNMSTYGVEPKKIRSCTCYNLENDGRGFFDQSGATCGQYRESPVEAAIRYLEEKKKNLNNSIEENSEIINKFLELQNEVTNMEELNDGLSEMREDYDPRA